jgi:hypothetical protein
MTPGKIPNSRRNLDIAINRLAKDEDDARRIRLVLANAIVGQMLPGGVVKGGSALKLRYGNDATRFTRDLDTARDIDLEDFVAKLRENLAAGWNGFTGNVLRREPAKPKGVPDQYVMQPFEIKLAYNQKSWLTVPLEIGHNEIGDTDEPEYGIAKDIVRLFVALGFPEPDPSPLMPLHHQIAQKLHGVSETGSDRAHDLIDMQVMVTQSELDYAKIKDTCIRLFAYRKLQAWPPLISKGEGWDRLYENQTTGLPVANRVDDAIVWANDFITLIDSAI